MINIKSRFDKVHEKTIINETLLFKINNKIKLITNKITKAAIETIPRSSNKKLRK